MVWRRLGIASLVSVLLSGCWLQPNFDSRHSRSNGLETKPTIDNVDTLHEIWSTRPGFTGAASSYTLVAAGGAVYVGYAEQGPTPGEVQSGAGAVDAASGAVRWSRNAPLGTIGGIGAEPITLVGDELYTPWSIAGGGAGCIGRLDRLDARSGRVVGSQDAYVHAVAHGNGRVVLTSSTVPCGDTLRVSVRDVGSTQTRFWVDLVRVGTGSVAPVITGDGIFVVAGGDLYSIDPAGCGASQECEPAWRSGGLALDGDTAPVASADGTRIFAATEGNEVLAIDATTGTVEWRAPGASGHDNATALSGDTLLVRAPGGNALLAYAAGGCGQNECEPVWSTRPTAARLPTAAGSVVYVGAQLEVRGYQIEAYDLAGCATSPCEPVATIPLSDTGFVSSIREIVVAEGRLLVAHGPVTAFAPG